MVDTEDMNQFAEYLPFKIFHKRYPLERGLCDKAEPSRYLFDYPPESAVNAGSCLVQMQCER